MINAIFSMLINSITIYVYPMARCSMRSTLHKKQGKPSTFYVEPVNPAVRDWMLLNAPMEGTSIVIPIKMEESGKPLYELKGYNAIIFKANGEWGFDPDTNKAWMEDLVQRVTSKEDRQVLTPQIVLDELIKHVNKYSEDKKELLSVHHVVEKTKKEQSTEKQGEFDI
ncbi:hypothetical protein DRQ32_08690 [bacterium]|nr:MAG: hypothetical protein DRQ32_08690 [bacterium]